MTVLPMLFRYPQRRAPRFRSVPLRRRLPTPPRSRGDSPCLARPCARNCCVRHCCARNCGALNSTVTPWVDNTCDWTWTREVDMAEFRGQRSTVNGQRSGVRGQRTVRTNNTDRPPRIPKTAEVTNNPVKPPVASTTAAPTSGPSACGTAMAMFMMPRS